MMTLRPMALAVSDVLETADFYNDRQGGLGDRFLIAVDQTFARILRFPRAAGRVNRCPRGREIRETLVIGFLHRIVYEINGTEILVASVTDARSVRQPWRRRLN